MILPSPFHPFMRLTDTSAAAAAIRKSSEADDYKLSFKYRCDDTSNANYQLYAMLRYADGNNYHLLSIKPGTISLQQKAGGTWSSAITKSVSTTQGDWYDLTVICDGSLIEVWRGEERLLQSHGLTGLAGIRVRLGISADAAYSVDDIDLKAVDGASYTYAYNDANELTAMNLNGVETHFTYDDWGRTASKYVGDGSVLHAEYGYRYGDKLKQVFSTFPGEEDQVHFIYDGLGKRRMKQVHDETNPAMEREWYRYDAGWNVVGQYADDPGGFWDIGGLESTAVWHGMTPLAEVTGSTPNGTYRHYTHDHLGSSRSLFDASKQAVGAIEYTPYGLPLMTAGVTPEYTFTGKPFDPEVGMYHFPYRQYSPVSARWLTRDPLGMVDGPNVYAYVGGRPLSYLDQLGREAAGPRTPWGPGGNPYVDVRPSTLPPLVNGDSQNPYEHCVNSCLLTAWWGEDAATYIMDIFKEDMDYFLCLFGHSGSCNSAYQPSDYYDNATGRDCATDNCITKGRGARASCISCCASHGITPLTPEGPDTDRPFGPYSDDGCWGRPR